MSSADPDQPSVSVDACGFGATRWSLIVAAASPDSPQAQVALAQLCEAYWYPLYAFVRRRGHNADEAQDLTQAFFASLLEKDLCGAADPAKGRFRAFLLAACKHFLGNERDHAGAQKRGGGRSIASLSDGQAEGRYRGEPFHEMTPEKLFERRWAVTLLDRALARLREEYTRRGKSAQFDFLRLYLVGDRSAPSHHETAQALRMTVGAIKVAVHRLRQRYEEVLREEISHTVKDQDEIDQEIRALFAALGP